jgi:hypothetical protein
MGPQLRAAPVRLVLATAAVLAVSAASTASAVAAPPTRDSVTGSFIVGVGMSTTQYTLDASSGPAGEAPTGTVRLTMLGGSFDMAVRCMRVRGNRAVVAARVPTSTGAFHVVLTLEDAPAGQLDRVVVFQSFDPFPPACEDIDIDQPLVEARDTSIVIVDAPVPPSSKKACRKDGWAQLGFASRRACKSAVVPPTR